MSKVKYLDKAAVAKRLSKISDETEIDTELLQHVIDSGETVNNVSALAYELARIAKEREVAPRTLFAQHVVQSGVADLAKNVEILHKRVTAFHHVLPARQFQYTLQDLVSMVDHLGDFLVNGPKEVDSEVPLSASMVPEEIPVEEAETIEAETEDADAELDNVVKFE